MSKDVTVRVRPAAPLLKINVSNSKYKHLVAFALLFFALALLRLRVVITIDPVLSVDSLRADLAVGFLQDAVIAALALAISALLSALVGIEWLLAFLLLGSLAWMGSLINTLYFSFFNRKLGFWMLVSHLKTIFNLTGALPSLFESPPVVLSTAVLGLFLAVCWRSKNRVGRPRLKQRLRLGALGICLFGSLLVARQAPIWFKIKNPYNGSAIADQIWFFWWDQLASGDRDFFQKTTPQSYVQDIEKVTSAAKIMRRFKAESLAQPASLNSAIGKNKKNGIQHRKELGLDPTKPSNVIVLFVESARAYEYLHPKLGPLVFPRLRSVIKQHGILYRQAYAAARATVSGQFSAQCSFLPNMFGAQIYLGFDDLKIRCIQQSMKENGYSTLWFHSNYKEFLNKYAFESKHGVDKFYDLYYFRNQGITERVGDIDWGYADGPVLKSTLLELERIAATGQAFYANILTISTHVPFKKPIAGIKLPKPILEMTEQSSEYRAFLSRWRYEDEALGDFFEKFFASPIADNTVVFLLGDHGIGLPPPGNINPRLVTELWHRIFFAIVTKNMVTPREVNAPIHQMDLAPTIAELTGSRPSNAWLGQSLLRPHQSRWLGITNGQVGYRDENTICYPHREKRLECFEATPHQDPLFDRLSMAKEKIGETAFWRTVPVAAHDLIRMNQVNVLDDAQKR